MPLPINGASYVFYVALVDASNPAIFKVNPTIAAGDFQISKDGAAFTNLTNLPTVAPAGSQMVQISLTADEMTADKVSILGIDVAGAEWAEILSTIDIPTETAESVAAEVDAIAPDLDAIIITLAGIDVAVQTTVDILEGDHIENSTSLVINKKGTTTTVLNKQITGSLLQTDIIIRTEEAP